MSVVGFGFTKIKVEKKVMPKGQINISNNIRVVNAQESEFGLDKSKKGLKIEIDFDTKYEPSIGSILMTGEVMLLEDAKKAEETLKEWNKTKQLPQDIAAQVLGMALNKCNIQAIVLSQLVNLPSPIPLPKVKIEAPAKAKK